MNSQRANNQPLMQRYLSLVEEVTSKMGDTDEWMNVFSQAKTDFQRICFLLKAIKSVSKEGKNGVEQLSELVTREEIEKFNGKDDRTSELYRLYSDVAWCRGKVDEALFASTTAVFYAVSLEQKALTFARRCNILYNLDLVNEAIVDGQRALT